MKAFLKFTLLSAGILAATLPSLTAADAKPAPTAPATPAHARLHAMLARRATVRHHLAKKLGLSSDQISQLKAARASAATTIKSIRADQSLTADQKKAKVRETLQSARKTMQGVLTADQQAKLQHFRAKHHKHSRRA
jgi:DNA-binding Xre family transcriptional regulator